MYRPVNDTQAEVLEWLVEGMEGPAPTENWKSSAVALQTRGLVTISRKGGGYQVTPTETGLYFKDHGTYPPPATATRAFDSTRALTHSKKTRSSTTHERQSSKPSDPAEETPAEVPVPELNALLDRPHPAVRSLWKNPVALPQDTSTRARAILAANALIKAAETAGLDMTGHQQPKKRSDNPPPYLGEALVTLDAGSCPVTVRIGECMTRVPHARTRAERDSYFAPRYDYLPSGLTAFRTYHAGTYGGKRYVETKTKPLAAFVPNIIAAVQRATQTAIETAERQRQWAEERRLVEIAQRELSNKRHLYEQWEALLEDQTKAWHRAQDIRDYVATLAKVGSSPECLQYIAWATGHADALDPTTHPRVPVSPAPDLPHGERKRLGRPGTWGR